MPNNKTNVGLVVIFCIIMLLGILYDLPYCTSVFFFLFLLFGVPMEKIYFQKKRVKLGIAKANRSNVCITRKHYLLLYVASAVIGSILNVAAVFFSMPNYLIVGMDIVIMVICRVIHGQMERSLVKEEPS